ncbi:hypothetical protein Emag_004569 [Eimeria magna]
MCARSQAQIRLMQFLLTVFFQAVTSPYSASFAHCWATPPAECPYSRSCSLQTSITLDAPQVVSQLKPKQLNNRQLGIKRSVTGVFSLGSLWQAKDAVPEAADGASPEDIEGPSEPADAQAELHAVAQELTSAELAQILEERGLSPKGAADRASLARSIRALLDTELQALEEDADSSFGPSGVGVHAANNHKQKLVDKLEALRRHISADSTDQEEPTDCPVPRWTPSFSPAEADAAQRRLYSWDSENYPVEEVWEGAAKEGGRLLPTDPRFVQLRDELRREVIALPAFLTPGEIEAAPQCLPSLSASDAKEPLFQGSWATREDPPKCARRQYSVQELLKDLAATCCLLEGKGQVAAGEVSPTSSVAAHQTSGASHARDRPEGSLSSLASLFPGQMDSSELIGRLYCSRLEEGGRTGRGEKRRGVIFLPGKLQARDARVRGLADRIAFCCNSLVVVPELSPASPATCSPESSRGRHAEGRLAAERLLRFGMHGLVARSLLWLRLHEKIDSLALMGLAEGAAQALTFAARTTAASRGSVSLPCSSQKERKHLAGKQLNKPRTTPEVLGLPALDTVVALQPEDFDIEAVAASMEVPTFAQFDDSKSGPLGGTQGDMSCMSSLEKASSRAAAFDKALRSHAKTRDHWVQSAPRALSPDAGTAKKLIEDDVLLVATSWLNLWMGRQVPEHLDAVRDVSGFELSFRRFSHGFSGRRPTAKDYESSSDISGDTCEGSDARQP